ncbi:MAG: type II toxin-antitoxin system RelE/ParE family toxin [Sphingobium sp.]
MKFQWTSKASSDLVRLHDHLSPVAPKAAYKPREVRRIIVGNYEMRYEIAAGTIFILRLWHCRENRSFEAEE